MDQSSTDARAARGRSRRPARARKPSLGIERFEDRALMSVALVSVNAAGTGAADGSSTLTGTTPALPGPATPASFNADHSEVAFTSDAADLVPGLADGNGATDVFVRDQKAGATAAVSVTPAGTAAGNGASFSPVISPDGRYVAFLSRSTNLSTAPAAVAAGTSPASANLYVRDLKAGTTTLIDATPAGKAADGTAQGTPAFSPDGTKLAFLDTSDDLAGNLGVGGAAAGPVPGAYLYVRDLAAGATSAVSVRPDGTLTHSDDVGATLSGATGGLAFSPDGTKLAFVSSATDLTANPAQAPATATPPATAGIPGYQGATNLFVRDLKAGTTTLVTATASGHLGDGATSGPVFSPDGTKLAFSSSSSGLTAASAAAASPWNPAPGLNLYLRDMSTGVNTLVSATPAGAYSSSPHSYNGANSDNALFSPDGTKLAFSSTATDLTANAPAATYLPIGPSLTVPVVPTNLFVRDLATGTTALASVTAGGTLSAGDVRDAAFSPDGTKLAFTTADPGTTAAPAPAEAAAGSPEGPGGDEPTPVNLYIRDLAAGTTALASQTADGRQARGLASAPTFSPDGTKLAFLDSGDDLTPNAPDPATAGLPGSAGGMPPSNIYVRNLAAGTTALVTATPDGHAANQSSTPPVFGPGGSTLLFSSPAGDLVGNPASTASQVESATIPAAAAANQAGFARWQYDASPADGRAVITVTRTGPAANPAMVGYSVQGGTAAAGVDFAATSGNLIFPSGVTSASFTVPILAGSTTAGPRTATLRLSDAIGLTLGVKTATLNIAPPTSAATPPVASPPIVVVPPVAPPAPVAPPTAPAPIPTPVVPIAPIATPIVATPIVATPTPTTPAPTAPVTMTPPNPVATPIPLPPTPSPTPTPIVATPIQTPAPTAPAPTTPVAPAVAGPTVTAVASQRHGQAITALVITFDKALNSNATADLSNFTLNRIVTTRRARHGQAAVQGLRPVYVARATYDPTANTVTLLVARGSVLRLGQPFQLDVRGTAGGVTDAAGNPLNGAGIGRPGTDFVATFTQPKHSAG